MGVESIMKTIGRIRKARHKMDILEDEMLCKLSETYVPTKEEYLFLTAAAGSLLTIDYDMYSKFESMDFIGFGEFDSALIELTGFGERVVQNYRDRAPIQEREWHIIKGCLKLGILWGNIKLDDYVRFYNMLPEYPIATFEEMDRLVTKGVFMLDIFNNEMGQIRRYVPIKCNCVHAMRECEEYFGKINEEKEDACSR